ncbi:MAG: histone deacetylase, partial [Hymenobacter sp.]
MTIAFAPSYILPLPPGHRFPMLKYELLPEQLLHEGTATASDFFVPTPPP